MAVGTVDHDVINLCTSCDEPIGELTLLDWRIQGVGVDGGHQAPGLHPGECCCHATATAGHVVQVHGLGQHQIRIGVKTPHKFGAVMVKVTLHVKALPHRQAVVHGVHRRTVEAGTEHVTGAVGDLGHLTCQTQSPVGTGPVGSVVVVATGPRRVKGDGASLHRTPGDLQRRRRRTRRQGGQRPHPVGEHHRPFQRRHPAHGSTHHAGPHIDAEMIGH